MFKLHCYINLKTSRPRSNKQNFYLLIAPERIRAITTRTSPAAQSTGPNTAAIPNFYSLHFSLMRKPNFIDPQNDLPSSKSKTKTPLDLLQGLATVTELTIHLTSCLQLYFRPWIPKIVHAVIISVEILRRYMLVKEARLSTQRQVLRMTTQSRLYIITLRSVILLFQLSLIYHSLHCSRRSWFLKKTPTTSVTRMSPSAQYFDAVARQINTRFDNLERSINERNTPRLARRI